MERSEELTAKKNRYLQLIEEIFLSAYKPGADEVEFHRADIERCAQALDIALPKNIGDVIYSFRYRRPLPESVTRRAPKGKQWTIVSAGRSHYKFVAQHVVSFAPNPALAETRIPDATPGVIALYALNDEQALLAKLRYNRLIDVFTRITCYSLQSHLRTTVAGVGQVETDEVYIGLDKSGAHYAVPVQAKGSKDKLSVVQIQQDLAMCANKFPKLICRPVGAQFMADDLIVLFEFQDTNDGIRIASEKHYKLVSSEQFDPQDLERYRLVPAED
ncbi:MAG TPA: endonuclease [Candidatus Hydrogenedentes bacterium]|nr:endonuclease [Candidatus Hydrogenedentota bacterium]